MELVDAFCHSQFYRFEESYNTVDTDKSPYIVHTINFM